MDDSPALQVDVGISEAAAWLPGWAKTDSVPGEGPRLLPQLFAPSPDWQAKQVQCTIFEQASWGNWECLWAPRKDLRRDKVWGQDHKEL